MGTHGELKDKWKIRDEKNPEDEATAKMVWAKLESKNQHDEKPYPLLWNAFPFHPHKKGNNLGVREPNKTELDTGKKYIEGLLEIFSIDMKNVFAVGRKAQESLRQILAERNNNLPDGARINAWLEEEHYIRHPSHGGKAEFEAGIDALRNL